MANKTHFKQGDRIVCRKGSIQNTDTWHTTDQVADVTCIPCKHALGLTDTIMTAKYHSTKCIVKFNGRSTEVPVKDMQMQINNVQHPRSENDLFLGKKSECITFKMELTEDGRELLRDLLFNMGMKK